MSDSKEQQLTQFVQRPGFGNVGQNINVRTNFFEITNLPDTDVYHYNINIIPESSPLINRKIFQHIEDNYKEKELGGITPIYDGRSNMFTPRALPFGKSTTLEVYLSSDKPNQRRGRGKRYKVQIKQVNRIRFRDLHDFINGKVGSTTDSTSAIMVLETIIRHKPSMVNTIIGRSFFSPKYTAPLNGGLEIWQGYYQACRASLGRVLVNIDLAATTFYEPGPLINTLTNVLNKRTPDELRQLDRRDISKIIAFVKGLSIEVTHRGRNCKKYKIKALSSLPANQCEFETGDGGGRTNVASYFKEKYNIKLNHAYLPCVIVDKNVHLPIEVCNVVTGQRYMKQLTQRQTADMIEFTCNPPEKNQNKIIDAVQTMGYRNNEYLKSFGVSVKSEMTTIKARLLPPPKLEFGSSSHFPTITPHDGVWSLKDKTFTQGSNLASWGVIIFANDRDIDKRNVENFLRELINIGCETGMDIPNKHPIIINANPSGSIETYMRQAWMKTGSSFKHKPQLLLCILPNTQLPLYAEIKRVSDTVLGVSTQCIQARHTLKPNRQYCLNVCLKMNVKLGGTNTNIVSEDISFVSTQPSIIIGAALARGGPKESKRPSIATMVATIDKKASRYTSAIRFQSGETDAITDMTGMVVEVLRTFYRSTGHKPKRILVYRNGLSHGMFKEASDYELEAIRNACTRLEKTYQPSITFVAVHKRHHAKFFPINRDDADETGNCKPGTVIEQDITHPTEFDFFLQSHTGIHGTSRSTHYSVLHDDNRFTSDDLQQLTFYLCYLYARCNRSVSLVPPAYYAQLLATRARFHVRDNHSDDQSDNGQGSHDSPGTVNEELRKVLYYM